VILGTKLRRKGKRWVTYISKLKKKRGRGQGEGGFRFFFLKRG